MEDHASLAFAFHQSSFLFSLPFVIGDMPELRNRNRWFVFFFIFLSIISSHFHLTQIFHRLSSLSLCDNHSLARQQCTGLSTSNFQSWFLSRETTSSNQPGDNVIDATVFLHTGMGTWSTRFDKMNFLFFNVIFQSGRIRDGDRKWRENFRNWRFDSRELWEPTRISLVFVFVNDHGGDRAQSRNSRRWA